MHTLTSFRASGDVARVMVGEMRLRAYGAGGTGFAERSWMAKAIQFAILLRVAEEDVLSVVPFPVEKPHRGVAQIGRADNGDDNGQSCPANAFTHT
jgi:hypothetical protein